MRVYELAKVLDKPSMQIIKIAQKYDGDVKNHMSQEQGDRLFVPLKKYIIPFLN